MVFRPARRAVHQYIALVLEFAIRSEFAIAIAAVIIRFAQTLPGSILLRGANIRNKTLRLGKIER